MRDKQWVADVVIWNGGGGGFLIEKSGMLLRARG